jgi:glycosyltransferase involved in cell wall biosynthesis
MAAQPRRVLHVVRTDGLSGAERHLAVLVEELATQGWACDVLVAAPAPERVEGFASLLRDAGATVRVLRAPRDASVALLRALVAALRSGRYDVVHSHLVHADWHLGLAGSVTRTRSALVSTKHNHDPFRTRRGFREGEALWVRRSAATIAISDSLADFVERWSGRRPLTVHYGLPAGPPPAAVPRTDAAPRELLAVGRLEDQKGFDVLIDAVAAAGDGVRVRIAGEGTKRAALERRIAEREVEDRVQLLGQRADVPALMAQADAFVHPARWEGFGLVLLEAMRAGLPVLASSVGAIPEVVVDGETGLLVPPDDVAALTSGLRRLQDEALLARLGRAGRRRLEESFPPALMGARTAEVYAAVVER